MLIEFYTNPRLPAVAIVRKGDDWFTVPNTLTAPAVAWSQRRALPPQDVQHLARMPDGSLYAKMMRPAIDGMTPAELKEARQSLGLTQQEMADALGVSKNHISAMERGAKAITPTVALLVAAYLSGWRPHDWPATTG